jgi:hypothetical protein
LVAGRDGVPVTVPVDVRTGVVVVRDVVVVAGFTAAGFACAPGDGGSVFGRRAIARSWSLLSGCALARRRASASRSAFDRVSAAGARTEGAAAVSMATPDFCFAASGFFVPAASREFFSTSLAWSSALLSRVCAKATPVALMKTSAASDMRENGMKLISLVGCGRHCLSVAMRAYFIPPPAHSNERLMRGSRLAHQLRMDPAQSAFAACICQPASLTVPTNPVDFTPSPFMNQTTRLPDVSRQRRSLFPSKS